MNPQQTRIRALLEEAATQDGPVDLVLQTELADEGYILRNLERDIERIREGAD